MSDLNIGEWPYHFEVVETSKLEVDTTYQRPLTTFWKEIRDQFNPALLGTLVVSQRKDPSWQVIDGQTRLAAARAKGLTQLPCLVFTDLSRAQEAELFSLLQIMRRGMRSFHRFRAQLVARKPMALSIQKIANDVGFALGVAEERYTLSAIAALEKTWKVAPEHLQEVLEIIRDVWGTQDAKAASAQIITGLSTFIKTQTSLDYERLRSRLKDTTPQLLLNRAAAIREGAAPGSSGGAAVAEAIKREYARRDRKAA